MSCLFNLVYIHLFELLPGNLDIVTIRQPYIVVFYWNNAVDSCTLSKEWSFFISDFTSFSVNDMCYTFIHDVAVTFEIKFVLSYDFFFHYAFKRWILVKDNLYNQHMFFLSFWLASLLSVCVSCLIMGWNCYSDLTKYSRCPLVYSRCRLQNP